MKNLQLLALLVLSLSFFACSDDEDGNNSENTQALSENTQALIGTWEVVSATCEDGESITSDAGSELARVEFTYFWDEINAAQLVFNANNSFVSTGDYTQVMTTTSFSLGINLGTQTTETEVDYSGTGTWELNGSTLTTTSNGGQVNGDASAGNAGDFEIVSINDTSMQLRLEVAITQSQAGFDISNTQTLNMMLTKM